MYIPISLDKLRKEANLRGFSMDFYFSESSSRTKMFRDSKEPLRIASIGSVNGLGGSQTAFKNLLTFLKAEGHETLAIAIGSKRQAVDFRLIGEHTCIRHERKSLFGKISKVMDLYFALRRINRFSPNFFISMGVTQSANFIASRLRDSSHKLTIDYIYGRGIDDPLLKNAVNVFDTYAVQSHSMIQPIESEVKRAKLTWLPCFPTPPIEGVLREDNVINNPLRIAFFGRLASNKGIDLLINAVSKIKDSYRILLDVWGSGPIDRDLENQINRLNLQSTISLKGRFPDGEAYANLLVSYDAIVLPSTIGEGLPLVLLEAMAYGVPYLTTDVGAIRDCCVNNPDAIMVAPTESDVCSGLIMLVEGLGANRFCSMRLRAYYEEHYSYDVMKRRWQSFLVAPNQFTGVDV